MRSDWNRPCVVMPSDRRRIALTVSYDGSAWHGWQDQGNAPTVQAEIEKHLGDVLGEKVFVQGSGRTDAGVHALGQTAHFDTVSTIPPEKFVVILNTRLPLSIRILSSWAPEGVFHARFTAMAREYRYFVKRLDDMLPFDKRHVYGIRRLPELSLLEGYAGCILGTHDFSTFCSAKDECRSKVRDIYVSHWSEGRDMFGFPVLCYTVTGNAFLYNQVRGMVGTMLEGALSGMDRETFRSLVEHPDRSKALTTAPPDGLYLSRVSYDEEEFRWFEEMGNGR